MGRWWYSCPLVVKILAFSPFAVLCDAVTVNSFSGPTHPAEPIQRSAGPMALTVDLEGTQWGVASIDTYSDTYPGGPWEGTLRAAHGPFPRGAVGLENRPAGRGWVEVGDRAQTSPGSTN